MIKLIEKDGWHLLMTRGRHRDIKHNEKSGLVTISGKKSDDIAQGTFNSVLKQVGLKNWKNTSFLKKRLRGIQHARRTLQVVLQPVELEKMLKKIFRKQSPFILKE